jgi:hypothetical protein
MLGGTRNPFIFDRAVPSAGARAKCRFLLVVWGAALTQAVAQTWTQTSAPSGNWINVGASADGTRITAVAMLQSPSCTSTNGGVSWSTNSLHIYGNCVACSADGDTQVAVGIDYDYPPGIYISTNAGAGWSLVTNMPWQGGLVTSQRWDWRSVACSADGSLIAAGAITEDGPGEMFVSTNSGSSWTLASAPGGLALASSADGRKLAAGAYSDLYTSTNSGLDWTKMTGPTGFWWWVASSADGTRLAGAVATNANLDIRRIYMSTNAGNTWTMSELPAARWSAVSCSADGSKLAAAAYGGGIYTSVDGGGTWASNSVPVADWTSVVSSADGDRLFALSLEGGIWTAQLAPAPVLNIASRDTNLVLSWTVPSTALVLQQSLDPTFMAWATPSNASALNLTNLQNELFLPFSPTNTFFRLASPQPGR